ncbi:LysR family transcriptional regulator [Verticiella sediminum]|uniref:LysR family transcriptional regulator n=1 Tax=Verticiella sediminum TaxID=1247510 RepID=A0A556A7P5_9BURK|nr:LysR substrate-binding domain-containing protein [Verticiella sediminum]TSH88909.1 LysR family transcriptional regulator [Verticiella sediminum]
MAALRQLEQFVVLAEELNFRRAAERLHMSQPPLSAAIQRLEQETGTALFERNRRMVRLTQAGAVLLEEARRVLNQARHAIEAARSAGHGLTGMLRLSFVPSAAYGLLPDILRTFRAQHPGVRLDLSGATTEQDIAALRRGAIDLALVVPPLRDAEGITLTPLTSREIVLAVPRTHRLAHRRRVALRQLVDESFVAFPFSEGRGYAGAVLAACQAAGFSPRIAQEAAQMQTVLTLVAGGYGIALVPDAMRALHLPDVVYVAVSASGGTPRYPLALAWPNGAANAAALAFAEIARVSLA